MAVVVKLRRVDGPLSSDEIDDNFQNLAEAVDAVADLAAEGIQIQSIATTTDGAAFVFTMTDGATFGPFTIPGAGLRPMGDWSTGLDYRRQDVALKGGSSYLCLTPHESGVFNTDLLAGKWALLAIGNDGTGKLHVPEFDEDETGYVAGDLIAENGTLRVHDGVKFRSAARTMTMTAVLKGTGAGGVLQNGDKVLFVMPYDGAFEPNTEICWLSALTKHGSSSGHYVGLELYQQKIAGGVTSESLVRASALSFDQGSRRVISTHPVLTAPTFVAGDIFYLVVEGVSGTPGVKEVAVTLQVPLP